MTATVVIIILIGLAAAAAIAAEVYRSKLKDAIEEAATIKTAAFQTFVRVKAEAVAHVVSLEASIGKEEALVKADLQAVVTKIKSIL